VSTTTSYPGSIASLFVQPGTRTQVTSPDLLVARTAELRDSVDDLSTNVETLHSNSQELQLAHVAAELELVKAPELLGELADQFVLPWALLARTIGVTPAAVRKWRRGERITPQYHQRLAEFVAFCRVLAQRDPRIDDVGHWLEMSVASSADVSRADLYIDGHRTELLDIARRSSTGEQVLDAADPGWRDRIARARHFQVVRHEDGSTSLVPAPGPQET